MVFLLEEVNVSANAIPLLRINRVCSMKDFATVDLDAHSFKGMLRETSAVTDDSDVGTRLQLSRITDERETVRKRVVERESVLAVTR